MYNNQLPLLGWLVVVLMKSGGPVVVVVVNVVGVMVVTVG